MIEEEVLDAQGVAHFVSRGDLVRIMSGQSSSYRKIGHVRGFTGKRIQVHLTDRHYGRAYDAKNLHFICFADSPRGLAYHKRWDTGIQPVNSNSDSSDNDSVASSIVDAPSSAHPPSGCVIL